MSIFAIADLHLPGGSEKPMDVFGVHWDRHFDTIRNHWQNLVADDDIVLIPGDISWAMQLHQAADDLQSIAALPGRKVLLRGNHDYWWSSITRVRALLPEGMYALQNDALALDGFVFCGTRGWVFPTEGNPLLEQDQKIYQRELLRLGLSLEEAGRKGMPGDTVVLMHFPPLLADGVGTAFSSMLEEAGVGDVVYGHLHGAGIKNGFTGMHNGVRYHLTSCDAIDFSPRLIRKMAG